MTHTASNHENRAGSLVKRRKRKCCIEVKSAWDKPRQLHGHGLKVPAAFTIGKRIWKPRAAIHSCSEVGHRSLWTPLHPSPQKLTFFPALRAGLGSGAFRVRCVDYDAATDVSGL